MGLYSSLRHPFWIEVFALSGCTRHETDRLPVPISRLFYLWFTYFRSLSRSLSLLNFYEFLCVRVTRLSYWEVRVGDARSAPSRLGLCHPPRS